MVCIMVVECCHLCVHTMIFYVCKGVEKLGLHFVHVVCVFR